MHRLIAHQHDNTPHCEAGNSDTHIHGKEFLITNCIVCCFQFSPSEETEAVLPVIIAPFVKETITPLSVIILLGKETINTAPRGPPFFLV